MGIGKSLNKDFQVHLEFTKCCSQEAGLSPVMRCTYILSQADPFKPLANPSAPSRAASISFSQGILKAASQCVQVHDACPFPTPGQVACVPLSGHPDLTTNSSIAGEEWDQYVTTAAREDPSWPCKGCSTSCRVALQTAIQKVLHTFAYIHNSCISVFFIHLLRQDFSCGGLLSWLPSVSSSSG